MHNLVSMYSSIKYSDWISASKGERKMTGMIHSSTQDSRMTSTDCNAKQFHTFHPPRHGCFYFACVSKTANKSIVEINAEYNISITAHHEAEAICEKKGKILWSPTEHTLNESSFPETHFFNIWTGIKRYNYSNFHYQDDIFKIEDKLKLNSGTYTNQSLN